jgi:hypothetical protein
MITSFIPVLYTLMTTYRRPVVSSAGVKESERKYDSVPIGDDSMVFMKNDTIQSGSLH